MVVHLPHADDRIDHDELESVVFAVVALVSFLDVVPVIRVSPTLGLRRVSNLSADIPLPIVVTREDVCEAEYKGQQYEEPKWSSR